MKQIPKLTENDRDIVLGMARFMELHDLTMDQVRAKYHTYPVDIRTFIEHPKYMNTKEAVYPLVMVELEECNSGKYVEAVFTGGIGSGKTTAALYTCAYQLYLLSCMHNAHRSYHLDPASEILFIFQNKTEKLAKTVSFARFKAMIEHAPYFSEKFSFDPEIQSKLVFPKRIEVLPVTGQETAAIGQNVMGGIIDELNYMDRIEKSKRNVDGTGTYDQAVAIYNSIARRRKSRFMEHGKLPGILCLVSSRRYPGQFTDVKEEDAKSDPTIFVYDKCTWDIKPHAYSGETFNVFIGNESHRPRIMEDDETVPLEERDLVRAIPVEHRTEFEKDIINSLREIAGCSTLATTPYITNTEAVNASMDRSQLSIFSLDSTDFKQTKVAIRKSKFRDLQHPRFAHVDLGLSSDSAGVTVGHVSKFIDIDRGDQAETLPVIEIDGQLEVRPPRNGEILFYKIRDIFYTLRKNGFPLRWITYDSYQSVDSIQLLSQQGFLAGMQSMDRELFPYEVTKSAIYDGRVRMPFHPKCRRELASLELDIKKGKVDHPPYGSKDLCDSLAGVVYGLSRRREVWALHRIPIKRVPLSLRKAMQSDEKAEAA